MLVSEEYAGRLRAKIDPNKAMEPKVWRIYPTGEKTACTLGLLFSQRYGVHISDVGGTTHAVVADRAGYAVSMTNTLGSYYGAGFIIGNTGMLASNIMNYIDIEKSPWTKEKSPTAIVSGL
jgi:gamma-glutamyltranspeptidase